MKVVIDYMTRLFFSKTRFPEGMGDITDSLTTSY